MVVVDPDAHYLEDHKKIAEYVPEPMRTRLLRTAAGSLLPNSTGDRWVMGRISRDELNYPSKGSEPEEIPEIMRHLGVDISVQLPNRMLALSLTDQRDLAVALADGFAQYMIDQVCSPQDGIYSMIMAPTQDPEKAAEIIYRYADNPGMCAVCIITAGLEPPLGHIHYDPIYRATQDVGLPLVYHSAGGGIDSFQVKGFERFLETHTLGFVFYNMCTIVSMLVQGLPERFPGIKFSFQEAGLFYIPMVMYRLDAAFRRRRAEAPLLRKLPSEYMLEFYYGTQPMDEPNDVTHLKSLFDMIDGPNTLVYSSDYPHWDYDMPSKIRGLPFLNGEDVDKILGGNALKLYRFEGVPHGS